MCQKKMYFLKFTRALKVLYNIFVYNLQQSPPSPHLYTALSQFSSDKQLQVLHYPFKNKVAIHHFIGYYRSKFMCTSIKQLSVLKLFLQINRKIKFNIKMFFFINVTCKSLVDKTVK